MKTTLDKLAHLTMRGTMRSAVRMPKPVALRLFGPPPENDRGAALDFQTHVMLNLAEYAGQPELHELGAEAARAEYHRTNMLCNLPPCELPKVEDQTVDGPNGQMPVRIYRPFYRPGLPACVYFHGGGFVIGGLDGYDGLCTALAERARCVVISVDYRLAPEHPFPAAVDDAVAAYRWVRDNAQTLGIDPERIAVAGDSAGGNLATVVCQQLVEAGEPAPAHQLLIYPTTDQRQKYQSHELFSEGFLLTGSMMEWFMGSYFDGRDLRHDPRCSPIVFERLDELPSAQVVTAGFDPLRDEGEAYADRLIEAGVPVRRHSFDGLIHSFITMGGLIDAAASAVADIAEELRRELHRSQS